MASKNEHYTPYELARWSVLIRQRDEMECFMCKRKCLKRREIKAQLIRAAELLWPMVISKKVISEVNGLAGEAHHIKAKFHYPKLALGLDNGVTLCWRCHRQVVHSTYQTFRIYTYPFRMYTLRGGAKQFNKENQQKVSKRFRT